MDTTGPPAPSAPEATHGRPFTDRPRIVGREPELGALRDGLAVTGAGRGRLFLVSGEAGIGKTRLADAFAEEAREAGANVFWGRSWEAGGAPAYLPWIQIMRGCLRNVGSAADAGLDRTRDQLAAILPELRSGDGGPPSVDDPEIARFVLFDAVTATLRAAASETPTVLILDDLHAADEPSILLLRFVASELADTPVMFVALYRDPELDAQDPRQLLLAELARHPAARRINPSALSASDISDMVLFTTGQRPAEVVVHAIARETEGNPLFVVEVARLLVDEGLLTALNEPTWRLPEGVKAVIGRRLDRLSDDCRSVLQVASVIGREFGLDLLGGIGMPMGDILAAIDEASAARVLDDVRGGVGRWRFEHVLTRDVLYESLSLPVRTGLHDRIGRVLERIVGDDRQEHLSELAHHFVAAAPGGEVERAVRYSRLAGTHAVESAAHEEGVRHFRNALAVLDLSDQPSDEDRCRILIELGEAQMRAGRSDARETLRQAANLADRLGLHDDLARAALAYAGRFVWHRAGRDPVMVPLLERALRARGDTRDGFRARLLARLAGALRGEPDISRRDALSAEALEIARDLGDNSILAWALAARTMAIWGPDGAEEMIRLGDELETLAESMGDIERIGDAQLRFPTEMAVNATREVAERRLTRIAETAGRLREASQTWYESVFRVIYSLAVGAYDGIDGLIEETRTKGRGSGLDFEPDVEYTAHRFALAVERDEQERVLPLLANAQTRFPGYWMFQTAEVFALTELGRVDDAGRQLAMLSTNGFQDLPRDNSWTWALAQLAHAAIRLDNRAAIEKILDLLLPYHAQLATAAGAVLGSPVARVIGNLATALGRFEMAEDAYREAIDILERTGWRPWEGWTRFDYGQMLRRRAGPGDDALAAQQFRFAAAIANELRMPALGRRLVSGAPESRVPGATGVDLTGAESRPPDTFRREGDVWAMTFEGHTTRLRHAKGLEYLARLLASPGREILAIDLAAGESTLTAPRGVARDAGLSAARTEADPLVDSRARRAYRERLVELQADIDEAAALGDGERASRLREEFQFLTDELISASGLGGRQRGIASPAERARQSVGKAIREALDRIDRHDRALGAHLRHAVRTGALCAYDPDPSSNVRWRS